MPFVRKSIGCQDCGAAIASGQRRRCDKCHIEKRRERDRGYRLSDPDRRSAIWKRYRERHQARTLLRNAKGRCKRTGLPITIDESWIQVRIDAGHCELSGLPFSFDRPADNRCGPFWPSLDRIDNSKGYTPENCRLICWGLNMALSEWGEATYAVITKAYLERSSG